MRTTLNITDSLLVEAKACALREGITVQALIERGLQLALAERRAPGPFRLRDAAVNGSGLLPESERMNWSRLLEASYEDGRH